VLVIFLMQSLLLVMLPCVIHGIYWYSMVCYGMLWYVMHWYGMECEQILWQSLTVVKILSSFPLIPLLAMMCWVRAYGIACVCACFSVPTLKIVKSVKAIEVDVLDNPFASKPLLIENIPISVSLSKVSVVHLCV